VGEVTSKVTKIRKQDPYKGKGVRIEGARIIRKAGKAGK
jgi:large subunit ribosomal protein L6